MSTTKYPSLIITSDRTFRVEGEFDSTGGVKSPKEFTDGKGYLDSHDNHIWVYANECPKDANKYPYFWIENGAYQKSDPITDIYDQFISDKLIDYSIDKIIKEAASSDNAAPLYNEAVLDDLYASSEIFRPVMYAKDDFLKKIIKTVLNCLSISLSKYKYKMSQKYMISNMKSGLLSPAKMSTMYFNMWTEMLGLKVTIIVESTDDADDKLDEPYVYLSERDSVVRLSELGPDFKFPEIPTTSTDE